MKKAQVGFEDFLKLDIRIGCIQKAELFKEVKHPAYKVWVNFGDEIGLLKSSAQVTDLYQIEELIGLNVLGLVNLPVKQIANFMSEFLLLGVYSSEGVVLVTPNKNAKPGDILG